MSYNTRKQRLNLYKKTFLEWTPEQRLLTFNEVNADLTLASLQFSKKPSDASYMKLCQCIGDVEVMVEVIEESFDNIRFNTDKIKKDKLFQLNQQAKINNLQEMVHGKQKELNDRLKKEIKPSLFKLIIKAPVVLWKYANQSFKELKLYFSK